MPSNVAELKLRRETISSMRIISPGKEINYFEGIGLNGLCPMRIFFSLVESRALEGERGQPISACLPFCTPHSLFFLIFLSFFSLPFLSPCLLICCDSLLEVAITVFVIVIMIPLCAR